MVRKAALKRKQFHTVRRHFRDPWSPYHKIKLLIIDYQECCIITLTYGNPPPPFDGEHIDFKYMYIKITKHVLDHQNNDFVDQCHFDYRKSSFV